jgi:hypothetical protein
VISCEPITTFSQSLRVGSEFLLGGVLLSACSSPVLHGEQGLCPTLELPLFLNFWISAGSESSYLC